MSKDIIKLVVVEANKRDVAKGVARIAFKHRKELGLPKSGSVIEITGRRITCATVMPAYKPDQDKSIVRIDRFTRKNAGTSIGEQVAIQFAKPVKARKVLLAPVDMRLNVDEDFTNFVRNRLIGRTFVQEDLVTVLMLGHPVLFQVGRLSPKGIVQMSADKALL